MVGWLVCHVLLEYGTVLYCTRAISHRTNWYGVRLLEYSTVLTQTEANRIRDFLRAPGTLVFGCCGGGGTSTVVPPCPRQGGRIGEVPGNRYCTRWYQVVQGRPAGKIDSRSAPKVGALRLVLLYSVLRAPCLPAELFGGY